MLFAEKYELENKLGEGAMGIVYRARHVQLDLEFAVKVLHPQYTSDPTFRARFLREARVAHAFVHKRSVMLRDFGIADDGTPYLTMDLCPGQPLAAILKDEGQLVPERAVAICLQVVDVLAEAHEAGILHRDIKPDNIMVDASQEVDQVKVMDFGIAKLVEGDAGDADLTRGSAIGTPLYMSPEQAAGERLDGRSDLYSLGVVLYEMVAGAPPFKAESVQALLMKHLTQPPPPLPPLSSGQYDPALEAILFKALAKKPDERFASAEAFHVALEAYLAGDVSSVPGLPPLRTAGEQPTIEAKRVRSAQHRFLSSSLGSDIRFSLQAEGNDEEWLGDHLGPLASIRPASETLAPFGDSGPVAPVALEISPAREVGDEGMADLLTFDCRPVASSEVPDSFPTPLPDEFPREREVSDIGAETPASKSEGWFHADTGEHVANVEIGGPEDLLAQTLNTSGQREVKDGETGDDPSQVERGEVRRSGGGGAPPFSVTDNARVAPATAGVEPAPVGIAPLAVDRASASSGDMGTGLPRGLEVDGPSGEEISSLMEVPSCGVAHQEHGEDGPGAKSSDERGSNPRLELHGPSGAGEYSSGAGVVSSEKEREGQPPSDSISSSVDEAPHVADPEPASCAHVKQDLAFATTEAAVEVSRRAAEAAARESTILSAEVSGPPPGETKGKPGQVPNTMADAGDEVYVRPPRRLLRRAGILAALAVPIVLIVGTIFAVYLLKTGNFPDPVQAFLDDNPGFGEKLGGVLGVNLLPALEENGNESSAAGETYGAGAAQQGGSNTALSVSTSGRLCGESVGTGTEPSATGDASAERENASAEREQAPMESAKPKTIASTDGWVLELDPVARVKYVNRTQVTLRGEVPGGGGRVEVRGQDAPIRDGRFTCPLTLREGKNRIEIVGYSTQGQMARALSIIVDTHPPELKVEVPLDNRRVIRPKVPVTGFARDGNLAEVRVNDMPLIVEGERFSGFYPLKMGENRLSVVAIDLAGNKTTQVRRVIRTSRGGR